MYFSAKGSDRLKYSVGYQLMENSEFADYIIAHKDRIREVYFAWDDFANGRNTGVSYEQNRYEAETRKREELKRFADEGLGMNLLLNGNCYGADSLSRAFFMKVGDTVEYLRRDFGVGSVTTTSPVIAKFIKTNFDDVLVRASVNMEIGTVQGMKYLAPWFDAFYMKREHNRDFKKIKELKAWCDGNGKELMMLANSGCLNHCSAHHFHDNLVAHEAEISKMDNAYDFKGTCWDHLADRTNIDSYLCNTNFIRPEDVKYYEEFFPSLKLATRTNARPLRVLRAYIEHQYFGSVMDLLEPNHSGTVYPALIDNSLIPDDYIPNVSYCSHNCDECGYCKKVLRKSFIVMEEDQNADK